MYPELRSIVQDADDIYLVSSLNDVDKVSRDLMKTICKVRKVIFLYPLMTNI